MTSSNQQRKNQNEYGVKGKENIFKENLRERL